jgi:hypothetical protein
MAVDSLDHFIVEEGFYPFEALSFLKVTELHHLRHFLISNSSSLLDDIPAYGCIPRVTPKALKASAGKDHCQRKNIRHFYGLCFFHTAL